MRRQRPTTRRNLDSVTSRFRELGADDIHIDKGASALVNGNLGLDRLSEYFPIRLAQFDPKWDQFMSLPTKANRDRESGMRRRKIHSVDGVEDSDNAMFSAFGHECGIANVEILDFSHAASLIGMISQVNNSPR